MEDNERRVWAIRGAITLDKDDRDEMDKRVGEMLDALYSENGISEKDVVFTLLSQTSDLRTKNAAASARKNGYSTHTPLFCVQEAEIDGMLPMTVRVLVEVEKKMDKEPKMVYLRGAASLRPDLRSKQ